MTLSRPPARRRGPIGITSIGIVAAITTAFAASGIPASAVTATDGSTGDSAAITVEPQIIDELSAHESTTFWVYLDDDAELDGAAAMTNRSAQGRRVYQELTATADASQTDLVELLDAAGADYEQFWIANTVKVTGDDDLLEKISGLPGVDQITADRTYALPEPVAVEPEATVDGVEWGVERIGAAQVWDTFDVTGAGIVVGSIDTGVQFDHPALVNQYRGTAADGTTDHNYNWWDPTGSCSSAPCDSNGHGTHTTGTMVGDDGTNHIGVAPGARWIAAKGCETRTCSQEALLSAGQFMLAPTDLLGNNPDPDRRPHIVNNSWGGSAAVDPWYQPTIDAWIAAGIFPQFSAGNEGPSCGTAGNPGNSPTAYAAGAFDVDDAIASFSSRGPSAYGDLVKPDIAAPGVAVRSSLPGDSFGAASGTSMASPHVAGAVALMWSAAPALVRDIDATRDILGRTAVDVEDLQCGGTAEFNNVWGEGRLDVLSAVEAFPPGPTGVLTGTVTDGDTGDPVPDAELAVVGAVTWDIETHADGTYTITIPAGDYDLTATATGYVDQTVPVTVAGDATTTVDVVMAAPDGPALALSSHTLDVGFVPLGTISDPSSVILTGAGSEPVTITGISGPDAGFALTGGSCPATPFTLDRWDTCTLDFTLRTLTEGAATTTVTLATTAPDGSHTVTLGGTAVQLPERIGSMSVEDSLTSALVDPDGRYAYFGTRVAPGRIVKVDLETFQRVGALPLADGEAGLRAAVMDPTGRFAYFATSTTPAKVIKVDLDTFERVDAITMGGGEGVITAGAIDHAGKFAYFATRTSPARVVKIDLTTFEHVDTVAFEPREILSGALAIDPDDRFAYVAVGGPGKVIKVDLATFQRVGAINLAPEETSPTAAVMDPAGRHLYVTAGGYPGKLAKIDVETFTRTGGIALPVGPTTVLSAVLDSRGVYGYFGSGGFPGRVVKVDLATLEPVDVTVLNDGEERLATVVADPRGEFAYFGTTSRHVVKVQIDTEFSVAAQPLRERANHRVSLTWDGSGTAEVDIYRGGDLIGTVPNSGSYVDEVDLRELPDFTYRICDSGTERCTDDLDVTFRGVPASAPGRA